MKRYRFAGIGIELETDSALSNVLLPAGFEQDTDPGEPDIRVTLEVKASLESMPEGPPRLRRGRMAAFGDREHLAWWHPDLGRMIDVFPRAGKASVTLSAGAWRQTASIFDQLLMPALLPCFAARGVRAVHASAVDRQGRGLLVAGPSGSGKTTAALLQLAEGATLVADDLLFLVKHGGAVRAYGLGDGLRAREDVWSRFPQFRPGAADAAGKRRLGADGLPWVRATRPVACVLTGFPGLDGLLSVRQALPALLAVTFFAGDEQAAVDQLASFAQTVRLFGAPDAQAAAAMLEIADN